MPLDDDALDHLADLARLELAAADRAALRVDLERLLGYLAQLQDVDVGALAPMTRPWDQALPHEAGGAPPGCREDACNDERSLDPERLAALAPGWLDGRFRVARTVDESG